MNKYEMLPIGNGVNAVSMVPVENIGDRKLAIVDLDVLQRIASYLPKENFASIRDHFKMVIDQSNNLDQMINLAEDEIKFHRSVNLITEYKPAQ